MSYKIPQVTTGKVTPEYQAGDSPRQSPAIAVHGGITQAQLVLNQNHVVVLEDLSSVTLPQGMVAYDPQNSTQLAYLLNNNYVTYIKASDATAGILQLYMAKESTVNSIALAADIYALHHVVDAKIRRYQPRFGVIVPPSPLLSLTYAMTSGNGSVANYGTSALGLLAYPALGGVGPGVVDYVYQSVASNRIASLGGSVMLALKNGYLTYIPNPQVSTVSTIVDITNAPPVGRNIRVLAVNSNQVSETWYILVELDPYGDESYRGLQVFQSTTQAATDHTDWSIYYTILDPNVFPPHSSGTPGMFSGSDATTAIDPPYIAVSQSGPVYVSGSGYTKGFINFYCTYADVTYGDLTGITTEGAISVYYPDSSTGSFGPQFVPIPGTPTAGTYELYADPVHGLVIGGSVPGGCAPMLTFTVTDRPDTVFIRGHDSSDLTLSETVDVANTLVIPDPDSMLIGRFGESDIGGDGLFVQDPTNILGSTGKYTGNLVGVRTDVTSGMLVSTVDTSNPLCLSYFNLQFSVSTYPGHWDGISNFNYNGSAYAPDPVYTGCIEKPTVGGAPTTFNFNNQVSLTNGPSISGVAHIGSPGGPLNYEALGIGQNGETLVNPGTGVWSYWAPSEAVTTLPSAFPTETYLSILFGDGTFSPVVCDQVMVDFTGASDTGVIAMACYDASGGTYGPGNTYYAVFADGSLQARYGPAGTSWTLLATAFVPVPLFMPFKMRVKTGIVQCIWGVAGATHASVYPLPTGPAQTGLTIAFPTYEASGFGNDTFSNAAFLEPDTGGPFREWILFSNAPEWINWYSPPNQDTTYPNMYGVTNVLSNEYRADILPGIHGNDTNWTGPMFMGRAPFTSNAYSADTFTNTSFAGYADANGVYTPYGSIEGSSTAPPIDTHVGVSSYVPFLSNVHFPRMITRVFPWNEDYVAGVGGGGFSFESNNGAVYHADSKTLIVVVNVYFTPPLGTLSDIGLYIMAGHQLRSDSSVGVVACAINGVTVFDVNSGPAIPDISDTTIYPVTLGPAAVSASALSSKLSHTPVYFGIPSSGMLFSNPDLLSYDPVQDTQYQCIIHASAFNPGVENLLTLGVKAEYVSAWSGEVGDLDPTQVFNAEWGFFMYGTVG